MLCYDGIWLDAARDNPTVEISIPPEGIWIEPGKGYLGGTVERCGSGIYVCDVDGRSSLGRLFLAVHCTAGQGDLGFGMDEDDRWCLEIHCTTRMAVRIYAGMRIAQARFSTTVGDRSRQYRRKKYSGQGGACASRSWQDFVEKPNG